MPSTRAARPSASAPSRWTSRRRAPRTRSGSPVGPAVRGRPGPGRGGAEGVVAYGPGPGAGERGGAAHALEGFEGGAGDQLGGAVGGGLDEVEDLRVLAVGEVAQGGGAGRVGAAAGGLDEFGAVLGPGDGGEAAGGRGVPELGGVLVESLLGPFQYGADAPTGGGPGGAHLTLPPVEGGLLRGLADPLGDDGVGVFRPQPPGPGLVRLAHRLGEPRLTVGGVREAGEHGGAEGAQCLVVVTHGELVEGPFPGAADGGVPAQQMQGVTAAVAGEVAEDGQGEAAALFVGGAVGEGVVRTEEMLFDSVERPLQLGVEPRVVEGAGLHAPVVAWVAQDAALQRGERVGSLRREGVQGPVSASSLEEAEKGSTGRYVGIEHEVSIRCGGGAGNGISRCRLRGIFADRLLPKLCPVQRTPAFR